ncbi:MAG: SGNH/GDSL hydrolase family protein [Armatimonadota bacterium]|nr:SGNH/GDSL hydrolase family protein [Armatimonadota bacterium]
MILPVLIQAQGRDDLPAAFQPIEDDPDLPRVLLIGDSISVGYTPPVREMLAGTANVHRIPENGGPTTRGLERIDDWLGDGDWDVIHFNWGLHDLKIEEHGDHQVPIDEYEDNLEELVVRLKQTGAEPIWATTTPVPQPVDGPFRRPEDVIHYNSVARAIMREHSVMIDDLYEFALPQLDKIQRPRDVHFTEKGYEVLARQVVTAIKEALLPPERTGAPQ